MMVLNLYSRRVSPQPPVTLRSIYVKLHALDSDSTGSQTSEFPFDFSSCWVPGSQLRWLLSDCLALTTCFAL